MESTLEQRCALHFCFLLKKTASEAHVMLKEAYGDDTMSLSQSNRWFKRFNEGDHDVHDKPRSGRPSSCRNDEKVTLIKNLVNEDRRKTVRQLSEESEMSLGSVHAVLTEDLSMRRVAAKFVPRLLTEEQTENRLNICLDLQARIKTDPNFLSRVVTCDETWVYAYDPETKQQSSQWKNKGSPRPKKVRQVRDKNKVMLIVFFDIRGIIHK
jgi:hypothetical protein